MTRDEPPAHPLRGIDGDPPPPRREQLPLPQREHMANLEPQLYTPFGTGEGTPFAPFDAPQVPADASNADHAESASSSTLPEGLPTIDTPASGSPVPRTASGDTASGDTASGNTASGNTASGETPAGTNPFPAAAFLEGVRRAADQAPNTPSSPFQALPPPVPSAQPLPWLHVPPQRRPTRDTLPPASRPRRPCGRDQAGKETNARDTNSGDTNSWDPNGRDQPNPGNGGSASR